MTLELDEFDPVHEERVALEKMVYGTFRRLHTVFKRGDIPRKLTPRAETQLPTNSVLHLMDHLLDPQNPSVLPNTQDPLIQNEEYIVYLAHHTRIPDKTHPTFPVTERYRFVPGRYLPQIQKFYQTNKDVRRVSSLDAVLGRPNVLTVINYNPLFDVYLQGRMQPLRKFDIVLRSVLASVLDIEATHPGKLHHLQIPISGDTYTKVQFDRAFKVLTLSTVRVWDDPSFFFLLHFFGFLTDSATTILTALPQEVLDRLHVIFTCGAESIIYNLGDLKAMVGTNKNFYITVLRHVNRLKLVGSETVSDADTLSDDAVDVHVDAQQAAAPELNVDSTPVEDDPLAAPPASAAAPPAVATTPLDTTSRVPEPDRPLAVEPAPLPLPAQLRETVQQVVDAAEVPLSKAQRERALKSPDRLREIDLGGRPVAELLASTPEPVIRGAAAAGLEGMLPIDPSMQASSINAFDRVYVEQQLPRDLAAVLTSFAAAGMLLTDVREHDELSEFNRIRHYTTVYTDVTGKRHTVRFKLPIIDRDGTILLNGVRSRMIKQQVNLPIVKVNERRVNLASNYNKTLVERSNAQNRRFDIHLTRHLATLAAADLVKLDYGHSDIVDRVPYDYACLAARYTALAFKTYQFTFDYAHRYPTAATERLTPGDKDASALYRQYEDALQSVYCGRKGKLHLFYGMDNVIRAVTLDNPRKAPAEQIVEAYTIRELLAKQFDSETLTLPRAPIEWTELKLLDRSFPVIFVLGYQFGLSAILDRLGHPYRFVPSGTRTPVGIDELAISFADGKLIFPRYPLKTGLILGGLDRFDMKHYVFAHLDLPDTYFTLLSENRLSTNYLKGIRDFFRFFVDPITRDVLLRMGEPVTPQGLLLRATELLSTMDHRPASSMQNHRMRGYERFADILYNEIARELANQSHQQTLGKRKFSINPEKVLRAVMQDATIQPVEEINPIHDIKSRNQVTYSGQGGRSGRSMMINDRLYPDDAVGILSEATPDSSKVAINAYFSVDPVLDNIRGMYRDEPVANLEPANVLSATALLMPGALQDDSKRIGYVSTQLSHHVPCQNGETLRVRTGYEKVVAHQTSETFACVAQADGVVETVDDDLKLLRVRYHHKLPKPQGDLSLQLTRAQVDDRHRQNEAVFLTIDARQSKNFPIGKRFTINGRGLFQVAEALPFDSVDEVPETATLTRQQVAQLRSAPGVVYIRLQPIQDNPADHIDVFRFGDRYTAISGSYLTQSLVLNVKPGDTIKAGDVLCYNSGFFEPDPDSRQVSWKHGVVGTVAFIDRSETYEDSCEISQSFAEKLTTAPGHVRILEMTNNTVVHSLVTPGQEVETTDYLAVIEDADLDALTSIDDPDTFDMLASLNRKMPRAKYHGRIAEVALYHACEFQDLHPSLQKLARQLAKRKVAYHQAYANTRKAGDMPLPQKVPLGTKYMGVDFMDATQVALLITIVDELGMTVGDKAVLANQAKMTISSVVSQPTLTASGREVDATFAASGTMNRMLSSHLIIGLGESILEQLEQDVLREYFGD